MLKSILLILSCIPFCFTLQYVVQAWQNSRMDHFDWIFYIIAVAAAIFTAYREKPGKCDFYALFLLIPAVIPATMPTLHHINALAAAASAGVIFAAVWLICSWHYAYRMLPAAIILLLGTPSSSYHLSLLLMCPVWMAWTIKFLLAGACLVLIYCNRRFDLQIPKGHFFFSAAVCGSCLLLAHSREICFYGRSCVPEFTLHAGDYWGRNIEPDANTKRFFATGTVKQFRYTQGNSDISVLAVQCGSDIHEIHPASHCLRTSRWTVHSEKILYLNNDFAVTEIDASKGGTRVLVWVWYSSEEFSTPGFLGFRRHFRPDRKQFTYQISITVSGSIESARVDLQNFIQLLIKGDNNGLV